MRRKLLTLFFLVLLSLTTAYAASSLSISYFLTIHLKDGSTQDILLDNRPTLSFDKSSLTVSTTKVEFEISDISTPSEIEEVIASEKPSMRITETEVAFLNVGQDACVNVYNISGQKVFTTNRAVDNKIVIDWSSFPLGLYIFHINKYSFKIMKK